MKHNYGDKVFYYFFNKLDGLDWAKDNSYNRKSWKNNICYSYNSEIAVADFDNKIIYLRMGSYSHTTSKHQRLLYSAIPYNWEKVIISNWEDWEKNYETQLPTYKYELDRIINILKNNKENLFKNRKSFSSPEEFDKIINEVKTNLELTKELELYHDFLEKALVYKYNNVDILIYNILTYTLKHNIKGSLNFKKEIYENKSKVS